jgi:hypothetical protein
MSYPDIIVDRDLEPSIWVPIFIEDLRRVTVVRFSDESFNSY